MSLYQYLKASCGESPLFAVSKDRGSVIEELLFDVGFRSKSFVNDVYVSMFMT